jgi:hypothetical protein
MREARVQRSFVLDEHSAAPQVAMDLVARDELTWTSREEGQQAGGLRSQPDSLSAFPQIPCSRIQLERSETDYVRHMALPRDG